MKMKLKVRWGWIKESHSLSKEVALQSGVKAQKQSGPPESTVPCSNFKHDHEISQNKLK